MKDWDLDENGMIRTRPILGWTLATMPMNAMIRLDGLRQDGTVEAIQFHLSASQCRELGSALLRRADMLDARTGGGSPQ